MQNRAIQRIDNAVVKIDRLLSRGRMKPFIRNELKAIRGDLVAARSEQSVRGRALDAVNLAICLSRLMELVDKWFHHLK